MKLFWNIYNLWMLLLIILQISNQNLVIWIYLRLKQLIFQNLNYIFLEFFLFLATLYSFACCSVTLRFHVKKTFLILGPCSMRLKTKCWNGTQLFWTMNINYFRTRFFHLNYNFEDFTMRLEKLLPPSQMIFSI